MDSSTRDWKLYETRIRPVHRARIRNLTPEQAFELYESMWEMANSIVRSQEDADRMLRFRRQEKLETRRKFAIIHKSP